MRQLVAVKGIGRWTAEIFLMFRLGRPDILPADDLGIDERGAPRLRLRKRPDAEAAAQDGRSVAPVSIDRRVVSLAESGEVGAYGLAGLTGLRDYLIATVRRTWARISISPGATGVEASARAAIASCLIIGTGSPPPRQLFDPQDAIDRASGAGRDRLRLGHRVLDGCLQRRLFDFARALSRRTATRESWRA